MLKVHCAGCNAPYEVDPKRVPRGGMKMRCPACDTKFMVTPDGAAPAAAEPPPKPPAAAAEPAPSSDADAADMPLGGLDLDMPGSAQGNFGGGDMFADLPAPGSDAADGDALELDLDLPAKKPNGAATPGTGDDDALELDLPAPAKPRPVSPGPPPGRSRGAKPAFDDLDLPAPKVKRPEDDADLPAPARPKASPKLAPDFDGVDLPTPAKPKPAAKLAPDFDGTDLPAPRSPAKSPSHGGAPGARPASPGRPSSRDGSGPPSRSFSKPGAPRPPAPAASGRAAGSMPKDSLSVDPEPMFEGGGDPFGGLDEPTSGPSAGAHIDLPAPRRERDLDLPTPKIDSRERAEADLPAPRGKPARGGAEIADLPAAKGGENLPGLPRRGRSSDDGVDLPAPRDGGADLPGLPDGGVDLPAARGQADLPTPKPAAASRPSLEDRLRAQGELPTGSAPPAAPKPPAAAKPPAAPPPPPPEATRAKQVPKDSLDFDSFQSMGGEMPEPFGLDDAADQPQASGSSSLPRTSAALSEGLKLPSSETGSREVERQGQTGASGQPSWLDDGSGDAGPSAPPLELDDGLPALELDAPADLPTPGADLDDLFGSPGPDVDASRPLDTGDDPFGLGEPPAAPPSHGAGAHEPLELGGHEELSLDLGESGASPQRQDAGGGFGELELDTPGGLEAAPAHADAVQLDHAGGRAAPRPKPRELGMTLDVDEPGEDAQEKKRKVPALAWVALVLLAFVGTGFGLGQTEYGLFGVYLIERFLPEAGDPEVVARQIEAAEEQASSDTYLDVRKSLRMLSDARMDAGLSHRLLSRSLLHEGLFRMRFGPDNASSQRSVAILSRLRERTNDAPSMHLAVAAHLAANGKLKQANDELAKARDDRDPYAGLVRGEILLLEGKPEGAAKQFAAADKHGGKARASFGLARAKRDAGDTAGARAAIERTLSQSPLHAGAHVQRGAWALEEGRLDEAEQQLLVATGWREVNGERIQASQARRAQAWSLLGRLYEERDYVSRALAAYDRALEADALEMDALLGSGRALLKLSRPREALSRFKSALQASPATKADALGAIPAVEAHVGAARAMLRLDEKDKAIEQLRAVPAALSENPDVTLWLGHAYEQKDEMERAESHYRKSIEKAPSQFAGYLALAQMLFAEKRPEEAAKVLDAAKEQVDDGADVRRMLGHSELSRNHIDAARQQFQAALKFEPENPGALFGLAVTQRREGKLEQAMATLDQVEALDPKFPALALERGRIHEAYGQYDEAIAVYEKALERREGDIDLQLQLGSALVAAGDLDRAEELLRAVLEVRPTSADAEHFIGRVVFARKDSAQAVVHFERSVNLDVTNARYHMYLAWASLESGNFAGALESIDKAIERDHTLGDAHWIKGRVQLRMGLVKDAIESFSEALKLSPGRTEAYADMGDAYEQLRKLRSAVKAYEAAVERDETRGDWWYRLGSLRLDRGKRREAMEALSKAIVIGDRMENKPAWLADAHRIYADSLRERDQDERALEHYALYLELAPPSAIDRENVERAVRRLRR